jgi:hypothetical protein
VAVRLAAAVAATVVALLAAAGAPVSADGAVLYSRLAPPPSTDWIESSTTATTLDGPFDAHSYAEFLRSQAPGSPSLEQVLRNLTFEDGYARAWVEAGSKDSLSERVFKFHDLSGAGAWYTNLQRQNQGTKYLVRPLPALGANPNSFGVVLRGRTAPTRTASSSSSRSSSSLCTWTRRRTT